MNLTRDRIQSIGWAITLALCLALMLVLTFRVNAVRSDVRLTERRIVALRQEKQALEIEFQTRSSQQQLEALNDVEFGFKAPGVGQYIEGEHQLAALSRPALPSVPDARAPVLMARADPPADTPADAPQAAAAPAVQLARAEAPAARVAGRAGSLPAVLSPIAGTALAATPGMRMLSHKATATTAGAATRLALRDHPAGIEGAKVEHE